MTVARREFILILRTMHYDHCESSAGFLASSHLFTVFVIRVSSRAESGDACGALRLVKEAFYSIFLGVWWALSGCERAQGSLVLEPVWKVWEPGRCGVNRSVNQMESLLPGILHYGFKNRHFRKANETSFYSQEYSCRCVEEKFAQKLTSFNDNAVNFGKWCSAQGKKW